MLKLPLLLASVQGPLLEMIARLKFLRLHADAAFTLVMRLILWTFFLDKRWRALLPLQVSLHFYIWFISCVKGLRNVSI